MRFHLFMSPGAWMSVHWRRSFLMVVRSFHLVTALARWFQQEGRRRSPSPTRPSSSRTARGRGWSGCLTPTTSRGMWGNLWRRPWREGLRETLPLKSHFLLNLTRETFWFCKMLSARVSGVSCISFNTMYVLLIYCRLTHLIFYHCCVVCTWMFSQDVFILWFYQFYRKIIYKLKTDWLTVIRVT